MKNDILTIQVAIDDLVRESGAKFDLVCTGNAGGYSIDHIVVNGERLNNSNFYDYCKTIDDYISEGANLRDNVLLWYNTLKAGDTEVELVVEDDNGDKMSFFKSC